MISIIITTYQEYRTLPKAIDTIIKSIDSSKTAFEILIISPDKKTQEIAKKFSKKHEEVKYIKDKGKGKPAALNLAFKEAKGKILILTDGDVIIKKNSIEKIYLPFRDKDVGAVSGRPITINSRKTLFGYWSHFLTHAAHQMRLKSKIFPCSGYLYAIRSVINRIPEDIFSEDAFITQIIRGRGYDIAYAPQAEVYVKYPDNLSDWLKQKIRSTGGYVQEQSEKERNFIQEIKDGIKLFFTFPETSKEFFWAFLLYMARLYLWFLIFINIKIKKRKFSDIWQRVESTK